MSTRKHAALLTGFSILIAASAQAQVPDVLLTSPLAETWSKPPTFKNPRLSPDGSKMLFLSQDPDGLGVALVLDFATGDLATVGVGTPEAYDLGWCEWANENRVLCDLAFSVNADGSDIKQIERGRLARPPSRSGACGAWAASGAVDMTMDWMPEDPEHVSRTCFNTQQTNILTGRVEDVGVGSGRDLRGTLISDGHNFTRLQRHQNTSANYDRWYFRNEIGEEWTLIDEIAPLDFEEEMRPVGFAGDVSILFHLATNDQGRWGLHAASLTDEPVSQELFTHPLVDIERVDTMGAYDRVVAAAYLDGVPRRIVVDARIDQIYSLAAEAFPGQTLHVVDESWDGSTYLILARPPGKVGDYYRMTVAEEGTIEYIGAEYAHLTDVELAPTRTVSFSTAEGSSLTGHLTLPVGQEGPFPTVIMPRSQASAQDLADPHYLVQYLAASGYAVLRMQNRGPERYDDVYLPNRLLLGWERQALDTEDAIRYLINEGVAEEGGICALGRDYGAYPALMHGLEFPGRLDCIITIAGVSNPRGGVWGTSIGGELNELQREGSPSRRAKEFDVPFLLFHGGYDSVIGRMGQTLNLKDALDRTDNEMTYIEYEHARHEIERAYYREDMLTRIGNFLAEHIGR